MKILCLYCASLSGDVLYPVVAAAPTRTIVHIATLTRTAIVVAAITVDVALHPPPLSPERASHDRLSSDQLYHPISQRFKQRKKKLTAPSSMQTARRASIISPTSNTMRVAVYPKRGESDWTIPSQNFPMKSRSLAFGLEKISSTKLGGK
jgi:hypothetical protein